MPKTLPTEVTSRQLPDLRLRLCEGRDQENLRTWKNDHRLSFFYKAIISSEQQLAWFAEYQKRPDDHVYLVEERRGGGFEPFGLVGCRKLEDTVDVYNVIRGVRLPASPHRMEQAMDLLCRAIEVRYPGCSISCKVLTENPAARWYEKLGFAIVAERPDHRVLEYRRAPK